MREYISRLILAAVVMMACPALAADPAVVDEAAKQLIAEKAPAPKPGFLKRLVVRTKNAIVGLPHSIKEHALHPVKKTKEHAVSTGHVIKKTSDKLEANGTIKTASNASVFMQLFNQGCQAFFWTSQFAGGHGTPVKLF